MAMGEVYLVQGKRTPQAKAGADLKDVAAPFLGTNLVRAILDETNLPDDLDCDVVVGNTGAPAKYANVARVIALEAGLKEAISAATVHRNCASGMEAVSQGYLKVASGREGVVFCGGVESMSQMPLIFNKQMTDMFIELMKAKSLPDKMKALTQFRFGHLAPVVAIEQGLTDPFCGLNMGETAEVLAREFKISRKTQDQFANESHHKAAKAQSEGRFIDEIVPLICGENWDQFLTQDVGPRASSTVEGLAKMRPYFDKKSGSVTVGNSCPITDGGSMCLLMNEENLKRFNLTPMARIVDFHFHGLDPKRMGLGPVLASHGVLKRAKLTLNDMDLVEINEAFSAQVLACLEVFKSHTWAKKFGMSEALGELPLEKLNVNGGAVALGHPVGSTGSRLVVTLSHELKKRKAKYGLASLCIGGGQGGAMIIENLSR
jgi:acetyl-CoA C-acetyltransferase